MDAILEEYDHAAPQYERLAEETVRIISALLKNSSVTLESISHRVKSRKSLDGKLSRHSKIGKYNKLSEVTDLCGIRVVCYTLEDCAIATAVIRNNFIIDEINSIDKSAALDVDRFGYKSSHLIVSLTNERTSLPENSDLSGLLAEVQIRTILQHAWASIEWVSNYKAIRPVSKSDKRKLHQASALIEVADQQLDEVYQKSRLEMDMPEGELSEEKLYRYLALSPKTDFLIEAISKASDTNRDNVDKNLDYKQISDLFRVCNAAEVKDVSELDRIIDQSVNHLRSNLEFILSIVDNLRISIPYAARIAVITSSPKETGHQIISYVPSIEKLAKAEESLLNNLDESHVSHKEL